MDVSALPLSHRHCRLALLLLVLILQASAPATAGQCRIEALEVPVTMNGLRPTIPAQINGMNALFTLDSGAWWSHITPAAAEQYQLHPDAIRLRGLSEGGINGRVDIKVATVATFTIFDAPIQKVDFLVGGTDPGAGTVGLLGQNLLRFADIEYDLARGAVHFLKTRDCKKTDLAYWVKPGETYSRMDIQTATAIDPQTVGLAYLNGTRIRVVFDTGATSSIVGLRAAKKAGIRPDSPGVQQVDNTTGLGRKWIKTWMATFPDLKIGDEEIKNARLRFADMGDTEMLLGADFFLSHHVYVATSQSKLYFTYNGGPVFDFAAASARASNAITASQQLGSPNDVAGTTASDPSASTPAPAADALNYADAPTLARHAASYAARRDFEHALHDYNRACELAPKEATYFYQRGRVQLSVGQTQLGLTDIQTTLELDPNYIDALLTRAEISLNEGAATDAIKDLDAVDRLAPEEAAIRYRLAGLYAAAQKPQASVGQLNLWIAHHARDAELPMALNDRCRIRAALNQVLDQAMDDCNKALRLLPKSAQILDSRAYVHLRRKEFNKAIADYDTALKINPKLAWSLYCRGLAKSRSGRAQDGASDMSAALAEDARIVERAKLYGID